MNPTPGPVVTLDPTPRTTAAWSLYTNGQGAKAVRDVSAALELEQSALLAALEAQDIASQALEEYEAVNPGNARHEILREELWAKHRDLRDLADDLRATALAQAKATL